jgi:hypothetical protein
VAGVREAAVLQDQAGTVFACIALAGSVDAGKVAQSVADAVSARFAGDFRVTRVVVLDEVPKTPGTGKVNRGGAAELLEAGVGGVAEFSFP